MWWHLFGRPLAARGYQMVLQSCRGTEGSGGDFAPLDERDDGFRHGPVAARAALVRGTSATMGPSYLGHTQWALVDAAADELAAMALIVSSSRFVRSLLVGGALASQQWLAWSALVIAQRKIGYGIGGILWLRAVGARRVAHALRHLPLGDADRLATRRTLPWWQTWLAHHEPDDEYWRQFDHSRNVSKVTAPVLMVTGWYDRFLPWQLADWDALDHQGDAQRLIIGPWKHDPSPSRSAVSPRKEIGKTPTRALRVR